MSAIGAPDLLCARPTSTLSIGSETWGSLPVCVSSSQTDEVIGFSKDDFVFFMNLSNIFLCLSVMIKKMLIQNIIQFSQAHKHKKTKWQQTEKRSAISEDLPWKYSISSFFPHRHKPELLLNKQQDSFLMLRMFSILRMYKHLFTDLCSSRSLKLKLQTIKTKKSFFLQRMIVTSRSCRFWRVPELRLDKPSQVQLQAKWRRPVENSILKPFSWRQKLLGSLIVL